MTPSDVERTARLTLRADGVNGYVEKPVVFGEESFEKP
jgi:hypothetical protein